jgi:hypothetical protein
MKGLISMKMHKTIKRLGFLVLPIVTLTRCPRIFGSLIGATLICLFTPTIGSCSDSAFQIVRLDVAEASLDTTSLQIGVLVTNSSARDVKVMWRLHWVGEDGGVHSPFRDWAILDVKASDTAYHYWTVSKAAFSKPGETSKVVATLYTFTGDWTKQEHLEKGNSTLVDTKETRFKLPE